MSYDEDDIKKVKALRNYYRRNFVNGGSDEAFLVWVECVLNGLRDIPKA